MDSIKIRLKKSSGEEISFDIPMEHHKQVLEIVKQTLSQTNGLPQNTLKQTIPIKPTLTQDNVTTANVPTKSEIKAFIRSQKNYQHNLKLISEHFFGFPLKYEIGNVRIGRAYDRLWARTMIARKEIKKEENDGDWSRNKPKGFGKIATFRYIRGFSRSNRRYKFIKR